MKAHGKEAVSLQTYQTLALEEGKHSEEFFWCPLDEKQNGTLEGKSPAPNMELNTIYTFHCATMAHYCNIPKTMGYKSTGNN
jgi:hypothetical protein